MFSGSVEKSLPPACARWGCWCGALIWSRSLHPASLSEKMGGCDPTSTAQLTTPLCARRGALPNLRHTTRNTSLFRLLVVHHAPTLVASGEAGGTVWQLGEPSGRLAGRSAGWVLPLCPSVGPAGPDMGCCGHHPVQAPGGGVAASSTAERGRCREGGLCSPYQSKPSRAPCAM